MFFWGKWVRSRDKRELNKVECYQCGLVNLKLPRQTLSELKVIAI